MLMLCSRCTGIFFVVSMEPDFSAHNGSFKRDLNQIGAPMETRKNVIMSICVLHAQDDGSRMDRRCVDHPGWTALFGTLTNFLWSIILNAFAIPHVHMTKENPGSNREVWNKYQPFQGYITDAFLKASPRQC